MGFDAHELLYAHLRPHASISKRYDRRATLGRAGPDVRTVRVRETTPDDRIVVVTKPNGGRLRTT